MKHGHSSLREAQKALTRSRIVEAARSVFERVGYAGGAIGLIAEEAAINRATFYLHFRDKADVFREVIAHDRLRTDEVWRELNEALLAGTRAAIESWLEKTVEWYRKNAVLMPAKHEAMASDSEFAREFQPRYDRLAVEIESYLDKFSPQMREDEKVRVQMLVVMGDQMLFHVIVQGVWDGPESQVREVLADIMCRSLGFE